MVLTEKNNAVCFTNSANPKGSTKRRTHSQPSLRPLRLGSFELFFNPSAEKLNIIAVSG